MESEIITEGSTKTMSDLTEDIENKLIIDAVRSAENVEYYLTLPTVDLVAKARIIAKQRNFENWGIKMMDYYAKYGKLSDKQRIVLAISIDKLEPSERDFYEEESYRD